MRYLLQVLADDAPGNSVEVRVPPFGAMQAVEGPRHTRGTPPNVIEMDAATWLALATGQLPYADALSSARAHRVGLARRPHGVPAAAVGRAPHLRDNGP